MEECASVNVNQGVTNLLDVFFSNRKLLVDASAKILGCQRQAEDVVHEVFFKLKNIANDAVIHQPLGYLCRIVKNLSIDFSRRLSLEHRYMAHEDEGINVQMDGGCPESLALQRESLGYLLRALSALPERTQRAFEMHRLEGYTQKEIAKHLGVSTTLVNFMIRDAQDYCYAALDY
jgi:RNA polymerase sigma factor (sigma-70 family)